VAETKPHPQFGRTREEVTEFVPACVTAIAKYWRAKGSTQISIPLVHGRSSQSDQPPSKIGRTEPMPMRLQKDVQKMLRQSHVSES